MNGFLVALGVVLSYGTVQSIRNCYEESGQIFIPWANNQLGEQFCQSDWFGSAWCVDSNLTCATNGGQLSGRSGSGCPEEMPHCCWNDYLFCSARTLNGEVQYGNCMLPEYCPSASVPAIDVGVEQCGGRTKAPGLVCCIETDRPKDYLPCVDNFVELMDRLASLNSALGVSDNKLLNFLPYFAIQFKVINESFQWLNGECASANYIATSVRLLREFADPNKTFNAIINNLQKEQFNKYVVRNLKDATEDGLITPRVFGRIMQILFEGLPVSGKGGSCDDYHRTTTIIIGRSYPCDSAWKELMTKFNCPPRADITFADHF